MADKRKAKRELAKLRHVKTWHLVVLFVLSLFVSATFLRLDNVGMVERRNAVADADAAGDSYAIGLRLYDLQRYSSTHMNANTGDVYLSKQYARDVEKITEEAAKIDSSISTKSSELLRQAYETCKNRYPGYSWAYTQCVGTEQAKIPSNSIEVATPKYPSVALYKHSYISPLWTPDFAGWSVLVSVVLAILVVIRFLVGVYLRWQLRRHYRKA